MKTLFYIFIGGGFGSILRFLISGYTQKLWTVNSFPLGTLLVNIAGCFLIGFISYRFPDNGSDLKFLLIAGFCGGFTTFSAFSMENFQLYQHGNFGLLLLNICLNVVAGMLAFWAGMRAAVLL